MTTVLSHPEGLHAIENASRDEIAGLQLERMKWSCLLYTSPSPRD